MQEVAGQLAEAGSDEPKSAEEILSESEELRGQLELHGSRTFLSLLAKKEREQLLKPFQAELIHMQ